MLPRGGTAGDPPQTIHQTKKCLAAGDPCQAAYPMWTFRVDLLRALAAPEGREERSIGDRAGAVVG